MVLRNILIVATSAVCLTAGCAGSPESQTASSSADTATSGGSTNAFTGSWFDVTPGRCSVLIQSNTYIVNVQDASTPVFSVSTTRHPNVLDKFPGLLDTSINGTYASAMWGVTAGTTWETGQVLRYTSGDTVSFSASNSLFENENGVSEFTQPFQVLAFLGSTDPCVAPRCIGSHYLATYPKGMTARDANGTTHACNGRNGLIPGRYQMPRFVSADEGCDPTQSAVLRIDSVQEAWDGQATAQFAIESMPGAAPPFSEAYRMAIFNPAINQTTAWAAGDRGLCSPTDSSTDSCAVAISASAGGPLTGLHTGLGGDGSWWGIPDGTWPVPDSCNPTPL
jgi:hypothetical protein